MRRVLARSAACFAFALAATLAPSAAHAEDPSWFVPEGPRTHAIALETNPLAFLIGRYGFNLEYVFAPHHAFVVSPHLYWAMPGRDDEIDGFGTELGYRFYTSRINPEGWFAGASFLVGGYRYKHPAAPYVTADHRLLDQSQDQSYQSYGGAIDVGYQFLLLDRYTFGAGVGLQYTAFTSRPDFETVSHGHQDLLYGSGLRPRAILATGSAF